MQLLFVVGNPRVRTLLEDEGLDVKASAVVEHAHQLGEIQSGEIFEDTLSRFRKWGHVIFIDCHPPLDFPMGTQYTTLRSTE